MRARPASGGWMLDWAHAIWSPFILEGLMRTQGWRLVGRWPERSKMSLKAIPENVVDVYRYTGGPI